MSRPKTWRRIWNDRCESLARHGCPKTCQGRGRFLDQPCSDCHGSGTVEQRETLTVKIPVGVEKGMLLRIPGRGAPCEVAGGQPGDLLVAVCMAPDAQFQRNGPHLSRSETIPLVDAVLGKSIEIPGLREPLKVNVPAGTQPGTVFRLRGEGLPFFQKSQRGDYFLTVDIKIPERLSREERRLFEELRALSQHSPRKKMGS